MDSVEDDMLSEHNHTVQETSLLRSSIVQERLPSKSNGSVLRPDVAWLVNGMDDSLPASTAMSRDGSTLSPYEPYVVGTESAKDLPGYVTQLLNIEGQGSETSETEATDEIADSLRSRETKDSAGALRSGIVYDVRMRYHSELAMAVKNQDYHPEDPRRIFHIYRELCKSGLVEDTSIATEPLVERPLKKIKISAATKEEICLVHDTKHFDFMESIQGIRVVHCDNAC